MNLFAMAKIFDQKDNEYMGKHIANLRKRAHVALPTMARNLNQNSKTMHMLETGQLRNNKLLLQEAHQLNLKDSKLKALAENAPLRKQGKLRLSKSAGPLSNNDVLNLVEGKQSKAGADNNADVSSSVRDWKKRPQVSPNRKLYAIIRHTFAKHHISEPDVCKKIHRGTHFFQPATRLLPAYLFVRCANIMHMTKTWTDNKLQMAGLQLNPKDFKGAVYIARTMRGWSRSNLITKTDLSWNDLHALSEGQRINPELADQLRKLLGLPADIEQPDTPQASSAASADSAAYTKHMNDYLSFMDDQSSAAASQSASSRPRHGAGYKESQPLFEHLLAKHGFTTGAQFSRATGVSQGHISRIKNGYTQASAKTLHVFQRVLGEPMNVICKAVHMPTSVAQRKLADGPHAEHDVKPKTGKPKYPDLVKARQRRHQLAVERAKRRQDADVDDMVHRSKVDHRYFWKDHQDYRQFKAYVHAQARRYDKQIENLSDKLDAVKNQPNSGNAVADPDKLASFIDGEVRKAVGVQNNLSKQDRQLLHGLHHLFSVEPQAKTVISFLMNASSPQFSVLLSMVHSWQAEENKLNQPKH